ncbi:MAG: hypothetical protein M3R59_01720 [Verrucomicrobiota bacterium]|nr:hypothetical protein [Verrucomicrobiota bacterium]
MNAQQNIVLYERLFAFNCELSSNFRLMTARALVHLAVANVLFSTALAGQHDDLAAWAKRDKASSHEFVTDLSRCKSAPQVALALRASSARQHKLTSDLIELVHRYPELRYVPELGLTNEGFRKWAEAHPQAAVKRAALNEPMKISQDLRAYTASLENIPESKASVRTLAQHRDDPDVIVATRELRAVLDDNEKRLLSTFR